MININFHYCFITFAQSILIRIIYSHFTTISSPPFAAHPKFTALILKLGTVLETK